MTILDALATKSAADAGPGWQECHVRYARRVLPPAAVAAFDRALAQPKRVVGHKEIADAVAADYGIRIDRQSIGRHRNGDCKCEPTT